MRRWGRRILVVAGVLVLSAALVWWTSPWTAGRLDALSSRVLFRVETSDSMVALTLDDGPSDATPRLLELLERHDARATFFVLAERARRREALTRRIVREGHELGNHFLRDRPTWRLSGCEVRRALARADAILDDFGSPRWVRPGGGWVDDDLLAASREQGYRVALGSVYPFDTVLPFPSLLAAFVLHKVHPGAVVVLHDGDERGERTAAVLERVLPELRARGYRVVTLSRLVREARRGRPVGACVESSLDGFPGGQLSRPGPLGGMAIPPPHASRRAPSWSLPPPTSP